jgi:hypothetical protein
MACGIGALACPPAAPVLLPIAAGFTVLDTMDQAKKKKDRTGTFDKTDIALGLGSAALSG